MAVPSAGRSGPRTKTNTDLAGRTFAVDEKYTPRWFGSSMLVRLSFHWPVDDL